MSRTFRTVGSGASQTTEPIENNKIPVYETKAAAEADIANLSDGQIIGTKDEGNENAKPVDVVQDGNMHAVTSNAVAGSCPRFPDYKNKLTVTTQTWYATEDCYITAIYISNDTASTDFYVDEIGCSTYSTVGSYRVMTFNGFIKKGQRIYFDYLSDQNICKIYSLK